MITKTFLISLFCVYLVLVGGILYINLEMRHPVFSPQKVPISDRITACEAKGGKYMYYYSELFGEYRESCEILSQKITDF